MKGNRRAAVFFVSTTHNVKWRHQNVDGANSFTPRIQSSEYFWLFSHYDAFILFNLYTIANYMYSKKQSLYQYYSGFVYLEYCIRFNRINTDSKVDDECLLRVWLRGCVEWQMRTCCLEFV